MIYPVMDPSSEDGKSVREIFKKLVLYSERKIEACCGEKVSIVSSTLSIIIILILNIRRLNIFRRYRNIINKYFLIFLVSLHFKMNTLYKVVCIIIL